MSLADRRIVAVIDLGSNSARLLVARALSPTAFEVVDEERFDARLGEGWSREGLAPAAFERGLRALRVMVQVARSFGPSDLLVVGTEALRRASDADDFVDRAWREAGVRVRVLSGEEEAYAGFLGVVNSTLLTTGHVIDLGGGSLELMRVEGRRLASVQSAPLGALYATERYLGSNPPTPREVRALRKAVRGVFDRQAAAGPLFATGGAVRNLARMVRLRRSYPLRRLHGLELTRREIHRLAGSLVSADREDRRRMPGIGSTRVDTLPAAAVVIDEVMDRLGVESLTVSGQGLREGVAWQALRGFAATIPDVRGASIAGLALANGVDELAAEPVVTAAGVLFEATRTLHGLGDAEGELLRHGARLAGIGMHVDYYHRDRHAEYLIHSGDLRGFTHREIVLLAGLAKGSAGGPADLTPYRTLLGDGDARRVTVLAAILGAARAVNRRRPSPVLGFVPVAEGGTLRLLLRGRDSLDAEAHALDSPARRLGSVLGLGVEVQVTA